MLKIELIPDLTHCIETVAKKEHANILSRLLAPGGKDNKLYEKLEILRLFLETADFEKLRSESEKQIVEGRSVRFVVYLEKGIPKYKVHIT
jgi:hypothetical protein